MDFNELVIYMIDKKEILKNKSITEITKTLHKPMSNAAANYMLNAIYEVDHPDAELELDDIGGVDLFFVSGFFTPQMENEFPEIVDDFLRNCKDKIAKFDKVGGSMENDVKYMGSHLYIYNTFIRLIYNGAKLKNEYCVNLLKQMHKMFYRQEFNYLKKFTKVSAYDIVSFFSDKIEEDKKEENTKNTYEMNCIASRLIVMSNLMGIKQEYSLINIYKGLNDYKEGYAKHIKEEDNTEKFDKILYKQCKEKIKEWKNGFKKSESQNPLRQYKEFSKNEEHFKSILKALNYPEEYVSFYCSYKQSFEEVLEKTLYICKKTKPDYSYSFEEIQRYAALYVLIYSLVKMSDETKIDVQDIIGIKDPEDKRIARFIPDKINDKRDKEPLDSKISKEEKSVHKIQSDESLLKEIDSLRKELLNKDNEIKGLKQQFHNISAEKKSLEEDIGKLSKEHKELIALRNFMYSLKIEDESANQTIDIETMKNKIATKKIVIIGGHINWHNKLKKIFPNWTFIISETFKTVNPKIFTDKDKAYFFTDHMGHVAYEKFVSLFRENDIPFGYLATINTEQIVKTIYEDIFVH